ncbi:hypothetical protein [Thermosulfidibacter takaii]|uniref:hypothetical protein n=1 Tax=Thermosulfidibacter takaii TaxID=412593 RepID=UPI0011874E74|nr:hypothetical protein [Thermosulfidibacter takaii]
MKKLLTGFLLFNLLIIPRVSWGLDRERIAFREALGLYTTSQYSYALNILKKYEAKHKLYRPESYLLMGYLFEITGDFNNAERYLYEALKRDKRGLISVEAATEDAAIRSSILKDPFGASIVLKIPSDTKTSKYARCYLLFNQIYLKLKKKLPLEDTTTSFEKLCSDSWIYNLIPESILHKQNQTPTPLLNEP